MRVGVYPGTFDPITLGHMDIIRRGAKLVDRLVIGVTTNITKSPMFDDDESIAMVKAEVASLGGDIRVVGFNALLMDFAEREGASMIVRGLRADRDSAPHDERCEDVRGGLDGVRDERVGIAHDAGRQFDGRQGRIDEHARAHHAHAGVRVLSHRPFRSTR